MTDEATKSAGTGVERLDELNSISFSIISQAGSSRSSYIEAIRAAKDGRLEEAENLVVAGEEAYVRAHDAHMSLVTKEASGEPTTMNLILTHAEDQLMSAESFGILACEFIDLYRKLADGK